MNEKVKILHVGKSLSGVDTYIRLIVKHLNVANFESIIVCGKNEVKHDFILKSGGTAKKYELHLEREFSIFKDFVAVFKTVRIIKKEKIRLLHSHSSKGGFIGRIAAMLVGIPVIYTPNAYSYLSTSSKLKRKVYLLYEKSFKYITTHLLACSESEYNRSVSEVGFSKSKCSFWKNSIEPIETKNTRKHNELLIAIGRPSYQKNTTFLIEVINVLKRKYDLDIRLKILGVGHYSPDKEAVVEGINDCGLSKDVDLIEWCSREETIDELGNALCYLSSSRYEGLSFSNLEALALGIPIVATDVDGNRDCTINNETGYLISENDLEKFTSCVFNICTDHKLRKFLSINSIRLFNESFNIFNTINKLESTYKLIINKMR